MTGGVERHPVHMADFFLVMIDTTLVSTKPSTFAYLIVKWFIFPHSPVRDIVVTNDRWGHDTLCQHGGFLSCEDRYVPRE